MTIPTISRTVNYNQCAFKHKDSYALTMPMAGNITISVLYDDGTLYIFNETVEGCINYTVSKIGTIGSFSFPVPESGEYSVAVQYTSNKIYIFNITVE